MTKKKDALLPTLEPPRYWHRKLPGAIVRGVVALAASGVTLWVLVSATNEAILAAASADLRQPSTLPIVAALVQLTLTALVHGHEVVVALGVDRDGAAAVGPRDLTGCLYVAREALLANCAAPTDTCLRITLHRRDQAGQKVQQLIDYVGGAEGTAKRKFSDRSGVVGRAVTRCAPVAMHRRPGTSLEEYIVELQNEWGMPEKEAMALTGTKQMSFMAVPISRDGDVVGVLYMDCAETDFFKTEVTKGLVLSLSQGVVKYLEVR